MPVAELKKIPGGGTSVLATPKEKHDYTPFKDLFGEDIILPGEITALTGFSYRDSQLDTLYSTLPSVNMLGRLRSDDYMISAGPPLTLTLLEICNQEALKEFPISPKSWHPGNCFLKDRESTWAIDSTTAGSLVEDNPAKPMWYIFRKKIHSGTWQVPLGNEPRGLLNGRRIPSAAELAWILNLTLLKRKMQGEKKNVQGEASTLPLYYNGDSYIEYALTSTKTSKGERIFLGGTRLQEPLPDTSGFIIGSISDYHWNREQQKHRIGIAPLFVLH